MVFRNKQSWRTLTPQFLIESVVGSVVLVKDRYMDHQDRSEDVQVRSLHLEAIDF